MTRSTGQWTGTVGGNFWYYLYEPIVSTNNLLIHFHGSGEGGLADGSQLSKVETNGYPSKVKTQFNLNGFELPFNIIAPQAIKNPGDPISGFTNIRKGLNGYLAASPYLKKVLTGLSQGGQEVAIWCFKGLASIPFDNSVIDGYIPVAGQPVNPDYPNSPDKPFYAIGGELDTAVDPIYTVQMVDGFNSVPNKINTATYDIIPGANHGTTYGRAYTITDQYGAILYNNLLEMFDEVPVFDPGATIDC